jgi:tRNA G18 (ribose-2'-O)-methylase SpoU
MKIESAQNKTYKKLLSLTKSKGIREHSQSLVSGEKITAEISRLAKRDSFWILSEGEDHPQTPKKQDLEVSKKLFKALDVCGTKKPLLCVDVPKINNIKSLNPEEPALFVALSDPTNLGALIRTCAAFDWQQIVLLKEAAHPFLPKAIRAASGTCFASRFFEGPSIKDLSDPEILALDMEGRNLKKSDIPKNLKLLVGEEGQGVPSTFPGRKVQIPISNRVESLNATIAASFLVYEWSKNH